MMREEKIENPLESELIKFDVLVWHVDEQEDWEGPVVIDTIKALTEVHARIVLRNGIHYTKKYPEGSWLDYILDGKRIELDIAGRVA